MLLMQLETPVHLRQLGSKVPSGNDTFAFASEASLVASGAVNGNGGADTISMTDSSDA